MLAAAILASHQLLVSAQTADGFVTAIDSPTEFAMGAVTFRLGHNAICKLQPAYGIQVDPVPHWATVPPEQLAGFPQVSSLWGHPLPPSIVPCGTTELAIGSRVQAVGSMVSKDKVFEASNITIDAIPARNTVGDIWSHRITGAALLEETADLRVDGGKLAGVLWVDGLPLSITSESRFFSVSSPDDERLVFRGCRGCLLRPAINSTKPLSNQDDILRYLQPNHWVLYEGRVEPNNKIIATRVTVWSNRMSATFADYLRRTSPAMTASGGQLPDSITFFSDRAVVIPDPQLQKWVGDRGQEMIPSYQKELSPGDPAKIKFAFYVVHPFNSVLGNDFVPTSGPMPSYAMQLWDDTSTFFLQQTCSGCSCDVARRTTRRNHSYSRYRTWEASQLSSTRCIVIVLHNIGAAAAGIYCMASQNVSSKVAAKHGFVIW